MRTNIVIDDELMHRAKAVTGLPTKRAVVDAALQLLVRLHQQEKIRELRGTVDWLGDLAASREGRFEDSEE